MLSALWVLIMEQRISNAQPRVPLYIIYFVSSVGMSFMILYDFVASDAYNVTFITC